jgi:stage III sporulation protein AF
MDFARNWSSCIMITAILITIVEMIVPEGEIKKVVILITGIIASITMATPVISFITDDFDLSQILKVEDYISDIEYSSSHNDLISSQVNMLEKEYSENILKTFNENYPNESIDSCRVTFIRNTEGKIITPKTPIAFFNISVLPKIVSIESPNILPTTGTLLLNINFAVFTVIPSIVEPIVPSIESIPTNNVSVIPSIHTDTLLSILETFEMFTFADIFAIIPTANAVIVIGSIKLFIILAIVCEKKIITGYIIEDDTVPPVDTIRLIKTGKITCINDDNSLIALAAISVICIKLDIISVTITI